MPVRDIDPTWAKFADDRAKVGDMLAGRDAALKHVRALPGFETTDETKFKAGAYFLPMTARASEAMGGVVFAKAPARNMPGGLDAIAADVTRTGQDVDRFAEQAFDGVLQTHTICIVVDHPTMTPGLTKKVAEARGIRPYLTLYDANAILDARFFGEGEERMLGLVRLLEHVPVNNDKDEFLWKVVEQVRVLDLDENGFYRQRLFRQEATGWQQYGETIEPRMNGQRMLSIPAYFANPRDAEPRPGIPPLRDLAEVNIAHLNDSALYQWGLMWTANPTPIFLGFNFPEGDEIKLGSAHGIAGPVGAKAEFMEFTGGGLSELRTALNEKRRDGAQMGARLLLEEGKAAIAAETARIQRAGETSIVVGIANSVSECLTKALTFLAEWAGVKPVVAGADGGTTPLQYWLNTDLNPAGLSAQDLTALMAAWQAGAISKRVLFAKLQAGDVIDPSKSFDDHEEEIAEEGAAAGMIDDDPDADQGSDPADGNADDTGAAA